MDVILEIVRFVGWNFLGMGFGLLLYVEGCRVIAWWRGWSWSWKDGFGDQR